MDSTSNALTRSFETLADSLQSLGMTGSSLGSVDNVLACLCGKGMTLFLQRSLTQPDESSIEDLSVIHEGKIYQGLTSDDFDSVRGNGKTTGKQELEHCKEVFLHAQQKASDATRELENMQGSEGWKIFHQNCREIQAAIDADSELSEDMRKRIRSLAWRRLEDGAGEYAQSKVAQHLRPPVPDLTTLQVTSLLGICTKPQFELTLCGRPAKTGPYELSKWVTEVLACTQVDFSNRSLYRIVGE